MKILLPYFALHDFDLEKPETVVGGIEKFILDIYQYLPNIIPLRIPPEDFKNWKKNRQLIIDKVAELKPNLLINQYIGGNHGGTITPIADIINIPILNIVNVSPGPIWTINYVQDMKTLLDKGHSLYFVSDHIFNQWNKLSLRVNNEPLVSHGLLAPGSIKTEPKYIDNEFEYDIVTIGRCEKSPKNPFLVHELGKKYKLRSLVLSNKIDCQYYEKNKAWEYPQVTKWNLPHDQVLETLSRCKIFVSTCSTESYGIAALEALSYGLPVLLNKKNESHASTSIVASEDHYRLFNRSDFFSKYLELDKLNTTDFRKEIQQKTYDKNSIGEWIVTFTLALQDTINRFKPKKTIMDLMNV